MPITPCRPKWKGTMTDRERFNNQMHYRTFDRTVNIEFGYWEENYKEWPLFVENGIANEWQANRFFNFDPITGIGGNVWLTQSIPPHSKVTVSPSKLSIVTRS